MAACAWRITSLRRTPLWCRQILRSKSDHSPSWNKVFSDSSHLYLSWVRNGLLMTVLGVSTRSPAADGDASLAVRMEENSVSIGFLSLAAGCLTFGSAQHVAVALRLHRAYTQQMGKLKLLRVASYTSATVAVWGTTVACLLKRDLRITLPGLTAPTQNQAPAKQEGGSS
eukprot:scpid82336/ scgid11982/ 